MPTQLELQVHKFFMPIENASKTLQQPQRGFITFFKELQSILQIITSSSFNGANNISKNLRMNG